MGRTLTQYGPAGRPARSMGTRHTDGRVELAGSIHRTTRSGPRFCSPEQWAGTLSPVDSNFKASSQKVVAARPTGLPCTDNRESTMRRRRSDTSALTYLSEGYEHICNGNGIA
jgi:hypothetical protein